MSLDNHKALAEHREFWDSLQMEMLTSNKDFDQKDYQAFIERSFMFSIFFRGCTVLETAGFLKALGLKKNGYVILIELLEANKNNIASFTIDELSLHLYIKKVLYDKTCTLGPLLTNRMCILISHDDILPETALKEEGLAICSELAQAIEKNYNLKITAGIGSMHSLYSIYPSFTEALACLYYKGEEPYVHYTDLKRVESNTQFDYLITVKHFIEAVRLRKTDAYDYFGLLMDWIRPFSDATKRSKILELLVLAHHSISLDDQDDQKPLDYIGVAADLLSYDGNQLIDYGYQLFIYITRYEKPQNSIDYSNHIVKATREYLENHYSDDISLEDIAEQVNISPQYFSKLIKKTTGFNFIDWLSMLRVKKAKELLTNSNLTVKEVCFMVGYKDPNYFSRIFKKRIGLTPSEYVKANSFISNKS
ncbi:MAG TPA: AraC family transcriptional regulator [Mobilitalea sp.]|nr:AraC family transcriptional regulator [Mobilitalea sp.]